MCVRNCFRVLDAISPQATLILAISSFLYTYRDVFNVVDVVYPPEKEKPYRNGDSDVYHVDIGM